MNPVNDCKDADLFVVGTVNSTNVPGDLVLVPYTVHRLPFYCILFVITGVQYNCRGVQYASIE
jgi:hypothetical protein